MKSVAPKCNDGPHCPICGQLSTVDFIPLALGRARARCQEFSNISFIKWDLKDDPAPGTFDLIDYGRIHNFGGRRDIRRACGQISERSRRGRVSLCLLYGDYLGETR